MPSGYTEGISSGKITNFQQFVWTCARGFGAFVMQRDDGLNAPLILLEEPTSYHQDKITQLTEEQKYYNGLTDKEWFEEYTKYIRKTTKDIQDNIYDKIDLKQKYENMLVQVIEWVPPNQDFDELKTFMINQLKESIDWDCKTCYDQDRLSKLDELTFEKYKIDKTTSFHQDIEYHQKRYEEECERVKSRNEWKRKLVESVGLPEKNNTDVVKL